MGLLTLGENIDLLSEVFNRLANFEYYEIANSLMIRSIKNWKLIIVDDNSNLATQKVLKNYANHQNINIIWLKKNKRAGFCRNLAIRNSKSEYIAFMVKSLLDASTNQLLEYSTFACLPSVDTSLLRDVISKF